MRRSDPSIFHSRLLSTGEVEFIYFDGRRVTRNAAELRAEHDSEHQRAIAQHRKWREEREASGEAEELRQNIRGSIQITHLPQELGYDDEDPSLEPVEDADDLDEHHQAVAIRLETDHELFALAESLDALQTDGRQSPAPQLANDYVTVHGMTLPLFEIYQLSPGSERTERDGDTPGEWFLGYRMSAAEAVIVRNDDDQSWTSEDGLHELRRILWIVGDRDELWDANGITSESTRSMRNSCVSNGMIVRNGPQRECWERAVNPAYDNDGVIHAPVLDSAAPLLVCTDYCHQEALTVTGWMKRTKNSGPRADLASRWQTLLDLIASGYNWIEYEGYHEDARNLLVCTNGRTFDQQLVDYWLAHPELPIPPERYTSLVDRAWQYPSDHQLMRQWWMDPPDLDDDK